MAWLNWLHLSDLHQRGRVFEREKVRDRLLDDLDKRRHLHNSFERIDFVVFSGDLAHGGKEEEYLAAGEEFLDKVLERVKVSKDRLILVPGNHDIDWAQQRFAPKLPHVLIRAEDVNAWLRHEDGRRTVTLPFREYSRFCRRYFSEVLKADEDPALCCVRLLDCGEDAKIKVAIAGLNSAWMCAYHRDEKGEPDDYGHLTVGEAEVEKACKETQNAEVRIAVMHHPFSWMSFVEKRDHIERRLHGHFHLILRGHEHEADVAVTSGPSGECVVIGAGAAYDSEKYPNGYHLGHLDLSQGQATVYSRRYESENGSFLPDVVRTRDNTGYNTFALPKELGRMRTSAPQTVLAPGDQWALQDPVTMEKLATIYESHYSRSRFRYVKSSLIVRAHCLAPRGSGYFGQPDLIRIVKGFEPFEEPLYCHRAGLSFNPEGGRFAGSFECETRGPIDVETILIPARSMKDAWQVLLFFVPPLQPGKGPYTLNFSFTYINSMLPLREHDEDELYLEFQRAVGKVETANLVLQYPRSFGKVEIAGKSEVGEEITNTKSIASYPEDFSAVGWRGTGLDPAQPFAAKLKKLKAVL